MASRGSFIAVCVAVGGAALVAAQPPAPRVPCRDGSCGGMDVVGQRDGPYSPRNGWERFRTRQIIADGLAKQQHHVGAPSSAGSITILPDVPYGFDACQRLDLYLPACRGRPAVLYVHGGSWISEDKQVCTVVGRYLATHGVAAALMNYRLPPTANVEQQAADVATAIAWARHHLAEYGADANRLFLCGHSSGGHLVSVVATNPTFLAAQGLQPSCLRGIIPVGGVYGIGANVNFFGVGYAFEGTDRNALSPNRSLCVCPPPFLIVVAEHDRRYMKGRARRFWRQLQSVGCPAEFFVVPAEDHYGQVLDIGVPGAPQGPRILDFIRRHE